MRPFLTLLTLLLLAACGGPDTSGMTECPSYGFRSVHTAVTDCATIQSRINFAHWLIVDSATATEEEWTKALQGTDLMVLADMSFMDGQQKVNGTVEWGEVVVGSNVEALAHELIHIIEANRGVLWTGQHLDWATNGNTAVDDHYTWTIEGESRPFRRCTVASFTPMQRTALEAANVEVDAWDTQLRQLPITHNCP